MLVQLLAIIKKTDIIRYNVHSHIINLEMSIHILRVKGHKVTPKRSLLTKDGESHHSGQFA